MTMFTLYNKQREQERARRQSSNQPSAPKPTTQPTTQPTKKPTTQPSTQPPASKAAQPRPAAKTEKKIKQPPSAGLEKTFKLLNDVARPTQLAGLKRKAASQAPQQPPKQRFKLSETVYQRTKPKEPGCSQLAASRKRKAASDRDGDDSGGQSCKRAKNSGLYPAKPTPSGRANASAASVPSQASRKRKVAHEDHLQPGQSTAVGAEPKPTFSVAAFLAEMNATYGAPSVPQNVKRDAAQSTPVAQSAPVAEDNAAESTKANANKRPASDDDEGNKNKKRRVDGTRPLPKGLTNADNACFLNAVIQMLDAAIDGHDLDELFGNASDVEMFGLNKDDIEDFDAEKFATKKMSKKLSNKLASWRDSIKKAAKAGQTAKVSVVKHFRKLLSELRADVSEQAISPYLFQSVVAWGAAADADRPDDDLSDRQRLSGDTQEDAAEAYRLIFNDLIEDRTVGNSDAIKDIFEIRAEVQERCSWMECGYKSDVRQVIDNTQNVDVPEKSKGEMTSLKGLLARSVFGTKDGLCEKCQKGTVTIHTKFTKLPDELVVRINRTRFEKGKATKVGTFVDLDQNLTVQGTQYELAAVVMHKGSISRGHYTTFRKHSEDWYLLDDKERTKKTAADITENVRKQGHAAMALYKKVST